MEVLIISKSFIVREALKTFFKCKFKENNVQCIRDISEVRLIDLSNINVIFVDLENKNIEDITLIKQHHRLKKVIIYDRENDEDIFIKAMVSDIDGYITDVDEKDDLDYVVNSIIRGKKIYETKSFENSTEYQINNKYDNISLLTTRENEVLQKVGKGHSNKDIAKDLHVTEHTIKKHISNILVKLDMKNRKELIVYTNESANKNLNFTY